MRIRTAASAPARASARRATPVLAKGPETKEKTSSDIEERLKETKATLEEWAKAEQKLVENAFNDIGKALSGEAFQNHNTEIEKLLASSKAKLEATAQDATHVAENTVKSIE